MIPGQRPAHRHLDSGWIIPALLLLLLSLMPRLISISNFTPEMAQLARSNSGARKHNRVVVFLVDGLGTKNALAPGRMPRLKARIKKSAFGTALASFPTITSPGLRAIMSGHRVASQIDLPGTAQSTAEADSVLARAFDAKLHSVVFGQFNWEPLFLGHGALLNITPYRGMTIHFNHGSMKSLTNYDESIVQKATPYLMGKRGKWDLIVVHLFESDPIGHSVGTENVLYRSHLLWVDRKIEELAAAAGSVSPTTFLLLGDHGQNADGSHGGLNNTVRQVPFMLWGAGINACDLGTFPLYDTASTLAALLGVAPPALNEGMPQLKALRLSPQQKAEALLDLFSQRAARWTAVRNVWPWLNGNPPLQLKNIQKLLAAGNYVGAIKLEERFIRDMDKTIQDALPEKWLGRLVLALWCVVFSSCFGLLWHRVGPNAGMIRAGLSLLCALVLILPLSWPNLWASASALVLCTSAGLLASAVLAGLNTPSSMTWPDWALWWLSLAAISEPEILDPYLWSWAVIWGVLAAKRLRSAETDLRAWITAAAAVLACALLRSQRPAPEASIIRSMLPNFGLSAAVKLNWNAVELAVLCALLLAGIHRLARSKDAAYGRELCALSLAPVALVSLCMHFAPSWATSGWLACGISLVGILCLAPSPELRGVCLGFIALAFYRTVSDGSQWCMLSLALLAGLGITRRGEEHHPLWDGLGLAGVALWSYTITGGLLRFSHITSMEGYRILDHGWHPYLLFFVIFMKHIAAVGTPILPWLCNRPLSSALGTIPVLGVFSAGNLSMFWWDRFMQGANQAPTDSVSYTRTVFTLILIWVLLGLWAALKGAEWVSGRLKRLS